MRHLGGTAMSYIKTWIERCDEHPDHQSGMVSSGMIQARMQEEIDDLREENERLRNEDTKTRHALKGWVFVCPDGGDEPTHERVAAVVAEVDRLRADLATQQGCCDGAAAQDAHIRQEREEHRAEVEKLRAENERMHASFKNLALKLRRGLEGKP